MSSNKNIKFLVDECVGKLFAELLTETGYDVSFFGDWRKAASDEEVLRKAEHENMTLVTEDKEFGELIFRLKRPLSGAILMRTTSADPGDRLRLLLKVMSLQIQKVN